MSSNQPFCPDFLLKESEPQRLQQPTTATYTVFRAAKLAINFHSQYKYFFFFRNFWHRRQPFAAKLYAKTPLTVRQGRLQSPQPVPEYRSVPAFRPTVVPDAAPNRDCALSTAPAFSTRRQASAPDCMPRPVPYVHKNVYENLCLQSLPYLVLYIYV